MSQYHLKNAEEFTNSTRTSSHYTANRLIQTQNYHKSKVEIKSQKKRSFDWSSKVWWNKGFDRDFLARFADKLRRFDTELRVEVEQNRENSRLFVDAGLQGVGVNWESVRRGKSTQSFVVISSCTKKSLKYRVIQFIYF